MTNEQKLLFLLICIRFDNKKFVNYTMEMNRNKLANTL